MNAAQNAVMIIGAIVLLIVAFLPPWEGAWIGQAQPPGKRFKEDQIVIEHVGHYPFSEFHSTKTWFVSNVRKDRRAASFDRERVFQSKMENFEKWTDKKKKVNGNTFYLSEIRLNVSRWIQELVIILVVTAVLFVILGVRWRFVGDYKADANSDSVKGPGA